MISVGNGNMTVIQTKRVFENLFGNSSGAVANRCPASLILLGDHTHYNDGVLISAPIDRYWTFVIKKRIDNEINIASAESTFISRLRLDKLENSPLDSFKLLRGLIRILKEENLLRSGFDCVVSSNVPECVGLGSTSAQQIGFLNALRKVFASKIENKKLLDIIRINELNIIGKISNTAHHYTAQFSKENKLFFIDLRSGEFKAITSGMEGHSLVICNSGVRITDPQNVCNERIEECEVGVRGLRLYLWGIKNLRDIKLDFLHKHFHMLPKRIFGRVLYNVKERMRAEESLKFLRKKSIREFGNAITESHYNLAEDYDLSNEHCDFIVEESSKTEGVYGSKIISCSPFRSTFHIVADGELENFANTLKYSFSVKFQKDLEVHIVHLSEGVKKISLKEPEHEFH